MTFTMDVHHHVLPDFFWQATNEGPSPVGGIAPPPWSRKGMLAFLDDARIDVAVTSISTPGTHTGDDAAARTLARRCNELSAELVRDRPERFGGFACLPLPDLDGALAELAYVTAHDNGPGPVASATLTATLPGGATATGLPSGCTSAAGSVTCDYGPIAVGADASRSFQLPLRLLYLGQVSVTATRTASTPNDPDPANDTATATCTVISDLLAACP
ncbi:amidohydrolase family protein [Streptacidiphilus sp. 4-A2]|nr:amidohydrolase family protein [Streptacidiphilus sp. 4-A2]